MFLFLHNNNTSRMQVKQWILNFQTLWNPKALQLNRKIVIPSTLNPPNDGRETKDPLSSPQPPLMPKALLFTFYF